MSVQLTFKNAIQLIDLCLSWFGILLRLSIWINALAISVSITIEPTFVTCTWIKFLGTSSLFHTVVKWLTVLLSLVVNCCVCGTLSWIIAFGHPDYKCFLNIFIWILHMSWSWLLMPKHIIKFRQIIQFIVLSLSPGTSSDRQWCSLRTPRQSLTQPCLDPMTYWPVTLQKSLSHTLQSCIPWWLNLNSKISNNIMFGRKFIQKTSSLKFYI